LQCLWEQYVPLLMIYCFNMFYQHTASATLLNLFR